MKPNGELSSEKRWEKLYEDYVTHPDGHWKGRAVALAPNGLADDIRDAMDFMGSLVDEEVQLENGWTLLASAGYWARGFEG